MLEQHDFVLMGRNPCTEHYMGVHTQVTRLPNTISKGLRHCYTLIFTLHHSISGEKLLQDIEEVVLYQNIIYSARLLRSICLILVTGLPDNSIVTFFDARIILHVIVHQVAII